LLSTSLTWRLSRMKHSFSALSSLIGDYGQQAVDTKIGS
jgi:hypothetical protein